MRRHMSLSIPDRAIVRLPQSLPAFIYRHDLGRQTMYYTSVTRVTPALSLSMLEAAARHSTMHEGIASQV